MNIHDFARDCVLRVVKNKDAVFTKSGASGTLRWIIFSTKENIDIKVWYLQDPIYAVPRFSRSYIKSELGIS